MLKKVRAQYERRQIELNLTRRGLLLSREVVLAQAADLTAVRTYRRISRPRPCSSKTGLVLIINPFRIALCLAGVAVTMSRYMT